ncbi:MAG: YecA family protein [Desulfobaccales bacterium]
MKKNKIGRNDRCPCGSGLKFKKCHGNNRKHTSIVMDGKNAKSFSNQFPNIRENIIELMKKEKKQMEEYGDIRPIISTDFNGQKIVAVGNELFKFDRRKTFQDFLFEYIQNLLGNDWIDSGFKKDISERHTIIQWQQCVSDFQKVNTIIKDEINHASSTGPVAAYLYLAYDLYILRHHSLLQQQLIRRLKDKNQFQGARYEVYVTASFIRASFDIEFEDDADKAESHCEFVATHKKTGKRYSVEAKSRHRSGILGQNGSPYEADNVRLRIGKLLRNALKKKATHKMVVFIDVNMPPEENNSLNKKWFRSLKDELEKVEKEYVGSNAAPEAYLFFTNHPYHYATKNETEFQRNFVMSAINMHNLKENFPESAQEIDSPVLELWKSIRHHLKIPMDFN